MDTNKLLIPKPLEIHSYDTHLVVILSLWKDVMSGSDRRKRNDP